MHVAGVRFTTLFILTHIKRFFIVFQTNYWTDVFVVRLLAGRVRVKFAALQSCARRKARMESTRLEHPAEWRPARSLICCSTVLLTTEATLSGLLFVRNSRQIKLRAGRHSAGRQRARNLKLPPLQTGTLNARYNCFGLFFYLIVGLIHGRISCGA